MAALNKKHPLPRPGVRQADRFIPALDPTALELEDRGRKERIEFAQKLATHIRFQRLGDKTPEAAQSHWTAFFDDFDFVAYSKKEREFDTDFGKFSQSPHGGLYAVYLDLLEHLRGDLNRLPKAHLDFYYRDVLQLEPKPADADRVHVVFEAAGNKKLIRVAAGTRLNAGKEITYATENEIFVGPAEIVAKHAIFADPLTTDRPRVAFDAQSLDGLGEPLTEDSPNWKPFGSEEFPALETGFAIASPILALKEGDRTVKVTVTLRSGTASVDLPANDNLNDNLIAEFSGEEAWLGPFTPESASVSSVGNGEIKLVLTIQIGADEDPISFHDVSKLEGGFDTLSPILKLSVDEVADIRVQRLLSKSCVEAIQIDVAVNGAKEFDLENDLGRLNPDKPFMPFGPQPVIGSNFYVSSEEVLSKKVTDFKLRVIWQDVPANLADHYGAYLEGKIRRRPPMLKEAETRATSGRLIPSNRHFKASMSLVKRGQEDKSVTVQLFDKDNAAEEVVLDSTPELRPLIMQSYAHLVGYFSKTVFSVKALFPGAIRLIQETTSPVSRKSKRWRSRNKIDQRVRVPNKRRQKFRLRKRKFGVIRVTLKQHFYHRLYPYYLAATIADADSEVSPQEPYTPTIESLELDYKATIRYDEFGKDSFSKYRKKTIQLYHLTPFGHAEQHAFLKRDLAFVADRSIRLTPDYVDAGALIIGVKNLDEGESLSALIQVANGTANPQKERQKIEWSLLVRNHWRPFEQSEVLVDETNQLLTSGIVRLKVPNEPLHDNTLFNPDLTWIRASVANDADAVCDFRMIHPHAVTAIVSASSEDNASGLIPAETIARFRTPVAAIKSISQPYASFGGRPAESTNDFYRRVSERLRHKQRAVTAADYERLVLEKFPQLHMVRCLTHTDAASCSAPGKVTLIVLPRTPPEARFERRKPRADLDTLSKIEDHVNSLNSFQITADVSNPAYEEMQLAFSVRFHSDRPFSPYRTILNEELIQFLSPWVSDAEVMPTFGVRLHKSQIIKFIENLEYVDFVTDVRLFRGQDSTADLSSIQPSSPEAILVSSSEHLIEEAGDRQ